VVLDEAQGYAVRAGSDRLLIDIATMTGDAWVSLARLDEAERVLGAALAAAKAGGDCAQSAGASVSLARCLFWRGQYADAQTVLGAPPDGVPATLASRHARLASRLAVGRADLRWAMSTIADVKQRFQGCGDPGTVAAIAGTAAFVHLAVGDLDAVDRDVAESTAAARAAHDPLRALKARLLLAEAERRRGRTASAQAQPSAPDTYEGDAAASPPNAMGSPGGDDRRRDCSEHLRRQIASTGLTALALYLPPTSAAPAAGSSLPAACEVGDVVAILRACQTAEDEHAVLKDLCGRIRTQLHAAAVGVVTSRNGRCDVLAGDGAGLDGDVSERAIAAGITIAPHRCGDRTEAAAPVQYGGAPIAALCARWTVGSTYDLSRAVSVLTMAATAAAPPGLRGARASKSAGGLRLSAG
jgi:hypothetical protein